MSESMCICCEVRKITKPELGLCGRCAKARPCCTFHADGGSPDLSCGGDHPNIGGTHLRDCAYHGGGDCTCGRGEPEDTTEYCSITGADMTPRGHEHMSACPCCGWHLTNGVCSACGQIVLVGGQS